MPNKIEVQLMDDPAPCWKNCTPYQRTAALYGHCKPKTEALRPTGEWNRITIFAQGQKVRIVLNGVEVIDENLSAHASNKVNPDGSKVPPLHTKPWSEIATRGRGKAETVSIPQMGKARCREMHLTKFRRFTHAVAGA